MAKVNPISGMLGEPDKQPAKPSRAALRQVDEAPAGRLVRTTVDLPAGRHAELQRWCLDAAVEVGTSRVPNQRVMSALVSRLLTDERLSRQIMADLRKAAKKR